MNTIGQQKSRRILTQMMRVTGILAVVLAMVGFPLRPERALARSAYVRFGAEGVQSPFVGQWEAIDVDGSDIRLTIAGPPGGPFQITWTESHFSFCGGEAGIARGTGWLMDGDPHLLIADIRLRCFTTGEALDFDITWIYDPGTNTISSGVTTWHRPGGRGDKCLAPAAGLTGWWPGDGNANDVVSGRNGEFRGDATTGSGLVDLAFSLDADGDFVEVPDSPGLNFGPGNFTVDLWVNFSDTSGEQVLVEKWIQGDGFVDGWTLTKLENQVLRLALDRGDAQEADLDSEELSILRGIWYHFAATRQGSVVTLFMNGAPVAQNPGMGASNLNSSSSLKFGHRGNPEDTPGSTDDRGFYLNGRIDEVELLAGTALSEDQILAIYEAGSAGKCKDDIQPPPPLDLRVNYGHEWVESFYEAGHMVWITVTESDGMTVKATAELVTEPKDFWDGETGFQTQPEDWIPAAPDIQPYDWVFGWVDNGARAQVQIGEISGVLDLEADSIEGTIFAPWFSSEVNVECHPWGAPEPTEMKFDIILPDGSDTYACSWAGEWDIQAGQDVGIGYFGPDGHWVANAFLVPSSRILASEAGDWFWTADFNPGTLNLFIYESAEEGAGISWQGSREADERGFVSVGYEDHGQDLAPGNYLVVSDGTNEKGLVLETITMEVFDTENDIMAGTAPAGRHVLAVAGMSEAETQGLIYVMANTESGAWMADFKTIGFDITEDMRPWSFAQIFDRDGDANEAGAPTAATTP